MPRGGRVPGSGRKPGSGQWETEPTWPLRMPIEWIEDIYMQFATPMDALRFWREAIKARKEQTKNESK